MIFLKNTKYFRTNKNQVRFNNFSTYIKVINRIRSMRDLLLERKSDWYLFTVNLNIGYIL